MGGALWPVRAAVPATQLIGPQIDAVAKCAPRAALRTEMQKLAVSHLYSAASGNAGLAETGLAFGQRRRVEQRGKQLGGRSVTVRRDAILRVSVGGR